MKNLNPIKTKANKASTKGNRKTRVAAGSRSKSRVSAKNGNGNGNGHKSPSVAVAPPAAAVTMPSAEMIAAILKALQDAAAKQTPAAPFRLSNKVTYDGDSRFNSNLRYVGDSPPITPGNAIVVLDLKSRSDLALGSFAYEVIQNLTDNPFLPAPTPTILELTEATKAFTDAITAREAALEQMKTLTQLKDQARAVVENDLKALQLYVQSVSQGDAAVITSAGLPVKRRGSRGGELSFPTGVVVNPGPVSGTLLISWNVVAGSKGFLVQCSGETNPRQWKLVKRTSSRSLLVEGLEPGKTYVFQVATAGGASGQSLWSPEVIRVCA